MTESIVILGRKLELTTQGPRRPNYLTLDNKLPYLYAWGPSPDQEDGWVVGIKPEDHPEIKGKGDTLKEAEKSFVANLEKYSNEAQKHLDLTNRLIAASREFEILPGPASICVGGVTFTRDDSSTSSKQQRLEEKYKAGLPYHIERVRVSHRPEEWWEVVCSDQCFSTVGHDTPEKAVKEAVDWMQVRMQDCSSDLNRYQERFDRVKNIFDSLDSLNSGSK